MSHEKICGAGRKRLDAYTRGGEEGTTARLKGGGEHKTVSNVLSLSRCSQVERKASSRGAETMVPNSTRAGSVNVTGGNVEDNFRGTFGEERRELFREGNGLSKASNY